jgi:hypothetical protein
MGRCKLIALFVLLGVLCASYADAQTGTSPVLPGKIVGSRLYKNGNWVGDTQILDFLDNTDLERLQNKIKIKNTARAVNVKDKLTNICSGTVDGRSTVNTLVNTGGAAAGSTLFIPSGCKILLSNPGNNSVAINISSGTHIECEDNTAGFVLARRYCKLGDTPGGQCDNDTDCPGSAVVGRCGTDGGLTSGDSAGNAPFTGNDATDEVTVFKVNSGARSVSINNCTIWANQWNGDYKWAGGTGKAWGYCSGGSGSTPTANCNQYCDYSSLSNWAATTTYATGAKVKANPDVGVYFRVTAGGGGNSGGSQPSWPTTIGATVTDGALTWTATSFNGLACNADADPASTDLCPTCLNMSHCASNGGTCSDAATATTASPAGPGKITTIDNSVGGGYSSFTNINIENQRFGGTGFKVGLNSYVANVNTVSNNELTTSASSSNPQYSPTSLRNGLPSALGGNMKVLTGMDVSENSLVINSTVGAWDNVFYLHDEPTSGSDTGHATVAFSRAIQMGDQTDASWDGTIGFYMSGLSSAAYFNDVWTLIGGKPDLTIGVNHPIFKGNNHDMAFGGARGKGPTWIFIGPHNDVQFNRTAWTGSGFLYSFGEIRGRCSGGSRDTKTCFATSGVNGYLGCPSPGVCVPNTSYTNTNLLTTGGGHAQVANNFLHSDQPTTGGLTAYVGFSPWGQCDGSGTSTRYRPCSTNDTTSTGCPGSTACGTTGCCLSNDWPTVLFNNNELYAVQDGVIGIDMSSTKFTLSDASFSDNLIGGYQSNLNSTIGLKFPSATSQITRSAFNNTFGSGIATPISGWSYDMGTLQFSSGLGPSTDQGTIINMEVDSSIVTGELVQTSATNANKVSKAATTTPGMAIGVALNGAIGTPTSAPTVSNPAGVSTLANSTTYYVVYTWSRADGETAPSPQAIQATDPSASGEVIRVVGATMPASAAYMRVYAGTASGGPYYYIGQSGTNSYDIAVPPSNSNPSPQTQSTASIVKVLTSGIGNCINAASGTIALGDYLTGDTTTPGRVTKTTGAAPIIGRAIQTAATNATFRCMITSIGATSPGNATSLDTGDGTDGARGIRFKDNTSNPSAPSSGYSSLFFKSAIPYVVQGTGPATPGTTVENYERKIVASDDGEASTTLTDTTSLSSFTMLNAANYRVTGMLIYDASGSTADLKLGVVLSNTTSSVIKIGVICNGGDGGVGSANGSTITASGGSGVQVANISAATTNGVCLVDGYVKFGTADGTFKLQHAANGTGTSTIKANSWLAVQRLP